jgi:hypothetical protein
MGQTVICCVKLAHGGTVQGLRTRALASHLLVLTILTALSCKKTFSQVHFPKKCLVLEL